MAGVTTDNLKDYFDRARTFDQEQALAAEKSRRLAWILAGVGGAMTLASVFAVAALAPLKTVEPFVVRIDNASGVVDVVNPLRGTNTYQEAVTKYFAALYVRAREGFMAGEAQQAFRTVTLMSADPEQSRFAAAYSGKNPESPQVVYGQSATAKINIKSISLLSPKLASVRYARVVVRGEEMRSSNWVATIGFDYVTAAMSDGDRMINPLGFQVREYRVDPEAP